MEFVMRVSYGVALIIVLALVILLPLATIWSLNTLFPNLDIQYTIETWLAAVFLSNGIFGKHVKLMK
jgi:hypothetical protein